MLAPAHVLGMARTTSLPVPQEPIPVLPTVHYNMGGIPTNYHGEVVAPKVGSNTWAAVLLLSRRPTAFCFPLCWHEQVPKVATCVTGIKGMSGIALGRCCAASHSRPWPWPAGTRCAGR
jgi:hypothetical protein